MVCTAYAERFRAALCLVVLAREGALQLRRDPDGAPITAAEYRGTPIYVEAALLGQPA